MATDITSRDDLPFTARTTADDYVGWHPKRCIDSPERATQTGFAYMDAVARLARVDEYEAHSAIVGALRDRAWNGALEEEAGFADALARLVLVGCRAAVHSEDMPFDTQFDPKLAQWESLQNRVELMEAQLKKAKMKPWREFPDSGRE